jgi:hypothetical protein
MQVAILFVAVVIGIRLLIDPEFHWRDLWALLLFGLVSILTWVTIDGPCPARFFALGFILGALVENAAMDYSLRHELIRCAPGTLTPVGWYPFTLPVERILRIRGWAAIDAPPLLATIAGTAFSGILFFGLVILAGEMWRLNNQTRRFTSPV